MKPCPQCGLTKNPSEFYSDISRKDKLTCYCRKCILEDSRRRGKTDHGRKIARDRQRKLRADPKQSEGIREKYKLLRRKYNKTPAGKYWNLNSQAKKRGVEFNIEQKEFEDWFISQTMSCYYCGKLVVFGNRNGNLLSSLTIDRKDNSVGYAIKNIVFSCRQCNTIKGAWFSEKEMVEIADKYLKGKEIYA